MRINTKRLAGNLGVRQIQVRAALRWLRNGYSVPYLAYYARSLTGGLSEPALREIARYLEEQHRLEERKQSVLKHIEGQERLTEELRESIQRAQNGPLLEELFFPFKQPQETPAEQAHAQGLSKLAEAIWTADPVAEHLQQLLPTFVNPDVGLDSPEAVLEGVRHLLAERLSQMWRWRRIGWRAFLETAVLVARRHPELSEGEGQEFSSFFDFRQNVRRVARYVLLALVRGERQHALQLDIEYDQDKVRQALLAEFPITEHPHLELIRSAAPEAMDYYLLPSLVGELRRRLYQRAEDYAAELMANHLRQLLLVRPMPGYRVIAIDPSLRPGCRVAVVDENGNVLDCRMLHLLRGHRSPRPSKSKADTAAVSAPGEHDQSSASAKTPASPEAQPSNQQVTDPPQSSAVAGETKESQANSENVAASDPPADCDTTWLPDVEQLCELAKRFEVQVIVIGNNNHCREVESLVTELIARRLPEVQYSIIPELGAAQYAGSVLGKEELPNLDAGLRLAVSLGRRFLDMLAELVKVDVPSLVGHLNLFDISLRRAQESVRHTLESVVNWVGADLNQASYSQLRYIAGLNEHLARNVVDYRKQHGPFRRREELLQVPGITEAVYRQAAAFLRIPDGEEPLDATWLHPDQYDLARRLLERLGFTSEVIKDPFRRRQLRRALSEADLRQLAEQLDCSAVQLREVMNHLAAAGRDPRAPYPGPILRQRLRPVEELQPGQMVSGLVLRVTDFGAFLDIGAEEAGLLHKSRLGHRKFHAPWEVVGVGEFRHVWIVQVDKAQKRIALSLLPPIARRYVPRPGRRRVAAPPPRPTPPIVMQIQPPSAVPVTAAGAGPAVEAPRPVAAPGIEPAAREAAAIPEPKPADVIASGQAEALATGAVQSTTEGPSPTDEPRPVVESKAKPAEAAPPPLPMREKLPSLSPVRQAIKPAEPSPEVVLGKKELRTFAELKAFFEARQRLQAQNESAAPPAPPSEQESAARDA